MHISDQYGPVDKGVHDLALPSLVSPSDAWTEGARQKELNERGAYIHRFNNQSSCNSMVAAVKKISEDNICTPCTLVGPSLCRTYNHHVWEGCAALLFSPSMPLALAYKGDIYSHRLSSAPDLNHNKFRNPQLGRKESLTQFSTAVRTTFNGYGPTSSAFKGRRTKQLSLVVSASHHAAKIREMEKRANLYFVPEENRSTYKLDASSKELILQLSDQYQDFNLPNKPDLQTKAQVLDFIDAVTLANPSLQPFLAACRIKISHFRDDSAVAVYFGKSGVNGHKHQHERGYTEFLRWQFNNGQTGGNLHAYSDKSTTLTPNEVLGMPSSEDLVGLVIDPSTSKSFDQALDTLEHLKKTAKSEWREVAKNIPPFTHLISHMDEGTVLQLGWSKMIIPYSTEGLKTYCSTGRITSIDNHQFKPDYFVLLHRIASSSALVFSKEYCTVDILYLKPNVINNFASISNAQGNFLLYDAIAQPSIPAETLRLFAHFDRLSFGTNINIQEALKNPKQIQKNYAVLDSLLLMSPQQIKEDLESLLSTQINRIEQSVFKTTKTHRTIKYRGGFKDHGTFEFNPKLGSLSLLEGIREYENSVRKAGIFKQNGSMKHGGAELEYGIHHEDKSTKFGNFNGPTEPLSISQEFSARRNEHYFKLSFGAHPLSFNISFSKSKFVRVYFELEATPGNAALKIQLRNYDWSDDLDQIHEQPAKVLSLLANTVQSIKGVPTHKLTSSIVCLAALRCACVHQQMSAATLCSLKLIQNPIHKETIVQLEEQFKQVGEDTEIALNKLVSTYEDIDPQGNDLCACLDRLPTVIGTTIRDYLEGTLGMTIQRPAVARAVRLVVSPSMPNLAPPPAPAVARTPLVTPTPSAAPTPVATPTPKPKKKSTMKKLMNSFRRAFKI